MDLKLLNRISLGIKALRQLGFSQVGLYGLYQFGLLSGHYRRLIPSRSQFGQLPASVNEATREAFRQALASFPSEALFMLYPLAPSGPEGLEALAKEICEGQIHPYGGPAVPLRWDTPPAQAHWTEYERGHIRLPAGVDIKDVWEPARFGWVFTLGRAYTLNPHENEALFFWDALEGFLLANPPYQGVQWMSGQEVALRLMALIYAGKVFQSSPHSTVSRLDGLYQTVIDHAARIPPTLVYARSQNNNHLLSEATGLYTAGWLLNRTATLAAQAGHPLAPQQTKRFQQWKQSGWHWLNQGLQAQIDPDGTYAQHSSNYHRLMLQLALWAQVLNQAPEGFPFAEVTRQRLASASNWLAERLDPLSGQVPNLGANDGAYVLPLTPASFSDYRPVVQAANVFELNEKASQPATTVGRLVDVHSQTRVFLRTVHYHSRPSHADPLHVDIWWQGINLARDAGTYRYNAPAPWTNALASAAVHNTFMVDNLEPMTPVSRFLWLDWAQSEITASERDADGNLISLTAEHDGYRRLGLRCQRRIHFTSPGHLLVEDEVLAANSKPQNGRHSVRLHWLLPDWPWQVEGQTLRLSNNEQEICLTLTGVEKIWLERAGECLYGAGPVTATTGWYSPTYGQKEPALAWMGWVNGLLPLKMQSEWIFPAGESDKV